MSINFITDRFEAENGKQPRGYGKWFFISLSDYAMWKSVASKMTVEEYHSKIFSPPRCMYSDAKRAAEKHFYKMRDERMDRAGVVVKSHGHWAEGMSVVVMP